MNGQMNAPVVSVIIATFNRSNILYYSIASVIDQSFNDWEMIVVGDCCTDGTEDVVGGFEDSRIRFINLSSNFGEQSGPNNEGLKSARGRYIAFLNHDDLWFCDHLEVGLDCMNKSNADLVFAGGIVDHGAGKGLEVTGIINRKTGYHPGATFVPASNWIFKRELIDEIGFWKPATALYLIPSLDWQQRVFKKGKSIVTTDRITVIAVPSSSRKNAYSDRSFLENENYFRQLNDPGVRADLLNKVIFDWGQRYYYDQKIYIRRFFVRLLKKALAKLGIDTTELGFRLRFGKGGVIKRYRQRRGLQAN